MRFRLFMLCAFLLTSANAADFTITTNAFSNNGIFPSLYTCSDKDISPELRWSNPPPKTRSFVLILSDPDAPIDEWDHWIVYNIPSAVKGLEIDVQQLPKGSVIAKNSWGIARYNGPCPPKGMVHTYLFTLYALDTELKLPAETDGKAVRAAMEGHVLEKVQLSTVYKKHVEE